jgi:phospholipid/cholesterol/gamma-HCH transport system ATP-binding protein
MIEIRELHKALNGLRVLQGVALTIQKGETMVVMGRSGCGKSVLLKHLVGLMKPDRGSVLIDGVDIVPLSEREMAPIRKKFGVLFQSAALFDSMSVFDNVAFPLREDRKFSAEDIKQRVLETLEIVGLAKTQDKMPAELSGGMRKRVGLARAVIRRPEIILYDEPTTGLDPIAADRINDLILQLSDRFKVTSVAVTHDLKSAFKIADRIAMLDGGVISTVGAVEEFKNSPDPRVQNFIAGVAGDAVL